jgi:hypothetical protein
MHEEDNRYLNRNESNIAWEIRDTKLQISNVNARERIAANKSNDWNEKEEKLWNEEAIFNILFFFCSFYSNSEHKWDLLAVEDMATQCYGLGMCNLLSWKNSWR